MLLGLLGAFGAAICYGIGSVLQAMGARRTHAAEGLDPGLLLRLVRSGPYMIGIALDCVGFGLSIVALRTLPLFVVQAVVASSLAVTAVLGAVILHMKLGSRDIVGLVVVVVGLTLLALSAAEGHPGEIPSALNWGLLIASVLLGVVAIPLARLSGAAGAAALGAVGGLGFGAVAVCARVLPGSWNPGVLLTDPATYALGVSALVGALAYSTALQRGTVTQATAPLVVGETIVPAAIGLFLLGDVPRPGWGWVAVVGFLLAVAGALSLSRHGEMHAGEDSDLTAAAEAADPTRPDTTIS
jgi:drug/metabolite transporter (DMT)-like permease